MFNMMPLFLAWWWWVEGKIYRGRVATIGPDRARGRAGRRHCERGGPDGV